MTRLDAMEPDPETDRDAVVMLHSDDATARLAPSAGGRLAQLTVRGRPVLVDGDQASHPMGWGSFPMAPWAGRIRHGRFTFDGAVRDLPINLAPHAIHGTTFERPWTLRHHDGTSAVLDIELGWSFGGRATQSFRLADRSLVMELAVHAEQAAMPAEIGWHPWFVKPDRVGFHPTARYERDHEGIAIDRLVEPGTGPFDDCFVNTEPVVVEIGGTTLTLTSDCDHWVLYDEPEHATCVEPQSGPPDAFTLRPRRLEPGETLRRRFSITW